MYGIMMVNYRPVDCDTKEPLRFDPGYISNDIYTDLPGTGWAFFRTGAVEQDFWVAKAGAGVNGGNAACARFDEGKDGNGITFSCRKCGMKEGYQPFKGAKGVSFWVKDNDEPGRVPAVRMTLGTSEIEGGTWCNNQVPLNSLGASEEAGGGWKKYDIDISRFDCPKLEQANQLTFETTGPTNYCVDEVRINK
jgi:cullin-associated NEDD8-dissociated protein 1